MTNEQRAALERSLPFIEAADPAASAIIAKWLAPPKEEVWQFPVGARVMARIILTGEPDSTLVTADTYRHLIDVFSLRLKDFES